MEITSGAAPWSVAAVWEMSDRCPDLPWEPPTLIQDAEEAAPESGQLIRLLGSQASDLMTSLFEQDYTDGAIIDAIREQRPAVEELTESLRVLNDHLKIVDSITRSREVLARMASTDPRLETDVRRTLGWVDGILDAALMGSVTRPINIAWAGMSAVHRDPDSAVRAFGLEPTIRIPSHEPFADYERFDRRMGLLRVCGAILRGGESYVGKPTAYYVTAIRIEAERDVIELYARDTDRLQMSPKLKPRLQRAGLSRHESRKDPLLRLPDAPGDLEMVPLYLDTLKSALSADDVALLMLVVRGRNAATACRELELPERAFENLQKRIRRRLAS
jgi:hypothetical protein